MGQGRGKAKRGRGKGGGSGDGPTMYVQTLKASLFPHNFEFPHLDVLV